YCDTAYAYTEGIELTEDEIVGSVKDIGLKTVEITGGEPMLQADVHPLLKRLLDEGYRVLIETNGSMDISEVDKRAVIILDIKTPGSGMSGEMRMSNLDYLKPQDEIKFVISSRGDYDWSRDFVLRHSLMGKRTILFSPVHGKMDPGDLSQWIIGDRLDVRLNLQLHKSLYGLDRRGV
ncbi:MAG TPA: 7-carboxy-7-deazaguanine synthase QueE, partial [Thermodesulfovibrionales bacterium]|nr:7-carboxy-7-deazaguanine synthase QueE [Thermodesulfovibrionales bacterium]